MFKQVIIHYPSDENDLKQISKDIAAFRCTAVVKYIETLKLNDSQVETLFSCLAEGSKRVYKAKTPILFE